MVTTRSMKKVAASQTKRSVSGGGAHPKNFKRLKGAQSEVIASTEFAIERELAKYSVVFCHIAQFLDRKTVYDLSLVNAGFLKVIELYATSEIDRIVSRHQVSSCWKWRLVEHCMNKIKSSSLAPYPPTNYPRRLQLSWAMEIPLKSHVYSIFGNDLSSANLGMGTACTFLSDGRLATLGLDYTIRVCDFVNGTICLESQPCSHLKDVGDYSFGYQLLSGGGFLFAFDRPLKFDDNTREVFFWKSDLEYAGKIRMNGNGFGSVSFGVAPDGEIYSVCGFDSRHLRIVSYNRESLQQELSTIVRIHSQAPHHLFWTPFNRLELNVHDEVILIAMDRPSQGVLFLTLRRSDLSVLSCTTFADMPVSRPTWPCRSPASQEWMLLQPVAEIPVVHAFRFNGGTAPERKILTCLQGPCGTRNPVHVFGNRVYAIDQNSTDSVQLLECDIEGDKKIRCLDTGHKGSPLDLHAFSSNGSNLFCLLLNGESIFQTFSA